jgi:hypothetical protein
LGDLAIWAILLEVTVKIAQIARFHFLYKKSHFFLFFLLSFFLQVKLIKMHNAHKSTRLNKWKLSSIDIIRRVIHSGALNEVILSKIAKPKRPRFQWHIDGQRCLDYLTESRWGRLIAHPLVHDPQSRQGRLFRRRFRVPFPVFLQLVKDCKDKNVFGRTRIIPVEIKVLCSLRMLGRDELCDTISELSSQHVILSLRGSLLFSFSILKRNTYQFLRLMILNKICQRMLSLVYQEQLVLSMEQMLRGTNALKQTMYYAQIKVRRQK